MRLTCALLVLAFLSTATAATIDTVAGTGERGYSGDGGPALEATLNQPFHCDLDRKGNLYIAEALDHCVRQVNLKSGIITTVAGSGRKGHTVHDSPATRARLDEPDA